MSDPENMSFIKALKLLIILGDISLHFKIKVKIGLPGHDNHFAYLFYGIFYTIINVSNAGLYLKSAIVKFKLKCKTAVKSNRE